MAAAYEIKRILTNIGPCDPNARYWPKKNTNISHTKTWTGMSMAALFMIAPDNTDVHQQVNAQTDQTLAIQWNTAQQ